MNTNKVHIEKNTVQETLVIPLFARKISTELYGEFFKDEKAVQLMEQLDYDFGDVEKRQKNIVERFGALEVAARQKAFLFEVKEYLKLHPNSSVVNLGCGLDQSAETCDNGTCHFYNVDFPDIINVREQLIEESERVHNVKTDLNDFSWFQKIPKENGVVFFASGVFYYFNVNQMKKLLNAMGEYFKGGILVFDIAGKFAAKLAIKAWVEQAGIEDVDISFYVGDFEKDFNCWLENGKGSYKKYMTGYFDLNLPCIPSSFRFLSKIADNLMKMKIIKVEF